MLRKLRHRFIRNLTNIPGWRSNRKIVVFESDDWGSIRMPSKEMYKKLLANNIAVDRSIYNKYDILEQREDLAFLFNLLLDYKDKKGNHPIFTFNAVMGNPAFDQIKQDRFEVYHHEDLESSYKRYNDDNIFDLWRSALDIGLMYPQFHAREHLNVSLWMQALQDKHHETLVAFKHNFFGLGTNTPSPHQKNYLAAYWPRNEHDFKQKLDILQEGLHMFKKKFGFSAASFVACNYIFPVEMEGYLWDAGIKYIQTQRGHVSPDIKYGSKKIRRHYTGNSNAFNQFYVVRNCSFEPTLNRHPNDTVDGCLKEIEAAFRWKKPAIISTHRINYVGGLATKNRDNSLNKLEKLLTQILTKWPEVEFMSTVELGKLMEQS